MSESIPVQSYQLDSWWYYKTLGVDGGLVRWEPHVNGPFAIDMEVFQNKTKKPVTLHNRWFSSVNDYCDNFTFVFEGPQALPAGFVEESVALFDHMVRFQDQWNFAVYEQDWLTDQMETLRAPRENVTLAEDWLAGMTLAAERRGGAVQYCMPLPSDYLISTRFPAVGQIRVSDDYNSEPYRQWNIGRSSMFASAVFLAPFKDLFRTTSLKANNPIGIKDEPNVELQSLVSVLSTGPYGIRDAIGKTDKAVLSRALSSLGTILKPSKPATAIELSYTAAAPQGDVWTNECRINATLASANVFCADLAAPFSLPVEHTPLAVEVPDSADSFVAKI